MSDDMLTALETMRRRLCAVAVMDAEGETCAEPAAALAASMLPDGSWADIQYENDHLKDWDAARHLERLLAMARGKAPLEMILRGLDGWYARDPLNPNWWWNQIGGPLLLGETLLHLKGACDASYITRAAPSFLRHEPIARFTGQNLVWTATVALYHGILTDDAERAAQALAHIGKEVRVLPREEGIQPDMSFFQHELLLYSGGYGQGFAADVGRLMALCAGTLFAFPEMLVERFARFLLDGSRWMIRGRTFEPGACGREITRAGHSTVRFTAGLQALASFPHARQAEAADSAAIDPAAGRSLARGNRHFWCADLMVQHRPDYYLSVHMASTRVLNADWPCCGGEGRLCHHMADGATYVMRDGDEYRDIYPVWNWRQVPGTTVVQEDGELDMETVRGFGARDFAGGASDGYVGCAAMDFARGTLAARKAWFLFDEGMVALGAGITCADTAPVRTTLNQCHWRGPALLAGVYGPLTEGEYPLAAGAACWHDGVTYRILDGAGMLRLGTQSGAWSDCGVGSPEVMTLPVLNAGLEHGAQPQNATYAYAVLPGVAQEDAFADDPARFVIARNDAALQAVWHAGDGRGHAVFYEPGSITFPDGQRIRVDMPCILLYHPRAELVTLMVAQPAQWEGIITLALTGPVNSTVGVSLPLGEYAGASVTVEFGLT